MCVILKFFSFVCFYLLSADFSSDSSVLSAPMYDQSIESELHAARLGLIEEIERRKTAEEALTLMQSHWQRLHNLLSEAGLTFPTYSNASGSMPNEIALIEELSQEVIVARYVAEAIGKGQARAEAELAAELIIESKDQEISRLRDRLQYYEAMNHEMSQRNLEIVGMFHLVCFCSLTFFSPIVCCLEGMDDE